MVTKSQARNRVPGGWEAWKHVAQQGKKSCNGWDMFYAVYIVSPAFFLFWLFFLAKNFQGRAPVKYERSLQVASQQLNSHCE